MLYIKGGWCPWRGEAAPFGGRFLNLVLVFITLLVPLAMLGLLVAGGIWLVCRMGSVSGESLEGEK